MQGYAAGKERKMDFEVRQVYYSYGKTVALDGLSFSANRGKIVDLIGENGAGKSTAIKSIYRFLPPDKGMILWDGKDIFSLRPDTYPISYILDTPVFYEELSLLEHLHLPRQSTLKAALPKPSFWKGSICVSIKTKYRLLSRRGHGKS